MTTSKLPSGKWRTRVYIDGKQISFTASTRAESVRLATQAANLRNCSRMTINAALRGYFDAKKGILSPSTAREYARSIERDFQDIGHIRTDKLTRAMIQRWISNYSESHSAKSTRNAYGLLSAALDLMCDLRFKVELPKIPPRTYKIPSESDFKQAIDECDPEIKKAVLLAGIGTMRRGEIAALTYGDIDGNVIHVHADKIRSQSGYVVKDMPKTSASDRYITYPSFVIDALGSGQCPPEILWRGSMNKGTEDYAFGISQEKDNYPPTFYGNGRINPTQNLVDAFPMANGYPISDPNSGYSASNPYAGRDPRLAEYVIYNGAEYKGSQIITGLYSSDNNGLNKTSTSTRTGYYLRKLLRDDCNADPSATNAQYHYPVYIRYTEIFLNYAEAANEAWGPNGKGDHCYSAYDVIKALHDRAGVGNDYLDSIAGDKDKMRELIRNERRIEMCFENKRFWDMRRWKLDLNQPAKGVEIKQDGSALTYRVFDVETRNYRDHMYYGPIPETEVLKWSNLDQNKGW